MNTLLTPTFRRDNRHSFSVAFFVSVMIDIRDGYWLLYQYKKQSNIKLDNQNFGNPYVDNKGQGISLHFVVLAQQEKMREMLRMQRESILYQFQEILNLSEIPILEFSVIPAIKQKLEIIKLIAVVMSLSCS